jgi:hypothetical protein
MIYHISSSIEEIESHIICLVCSKIFGKHSIKAKGMVWGINPFFITIPFKSTHDDNDELSSNYLYTYSWVGDDEK